MDDQLTALHSGPATTVQIYLNTKGFYRFSVSCTDPDPSKASLVAQEKSDELTTYCNLKNGGNEEQDSW